MFLDRWKLNYQGTPPSPLLFVFSDLLCACLNIEGKEVGDICHLYINAREYRKGNQRGQYRETGNIAYTRQRRRKKKKKETQYNMCWTPLYVNNHTHKNVNKTCK